MINDEDLEIKDSSANKYLDYMLDHCSLLCDANEPEKPPYGEPHPAMLEWYEEDHPPVDHDDPREYIERDYS
jgi:hypothetical protein